ncbi:MAG: anti-sigma factor [Pseudomonadota bacterium]
MNPVTEAELQAWVDGRLAPARRGDIDIYLEHHPHEAERLRAYRQQNVALRAVFGPVLDETIPRRMLRPRWRLPRWPLQRYAASLAFVLAGGAAGWLLHDRVDDDAFSALAQAWPGRGAGGALAHQAALAHGVYSPEVKHPVEVGADQQEHLVAWLSKRLGTPLHPPRLAPLGYELEGGRLLPGEHGPVAQFMYHDGNGQRLTLYVSSGQRDSKESGFRYAREGGISVFYWIDGSFGYALSGVLGKAELARIATAVYQQLQPS